MPSSSRSRWASRSSASTFSASTTRARSTLVAVERDDGRLDLVELLGDPPVVALEPVDERGEVRVRVAQSREQGDVLEPVVTVHEAAVVQAVHLQRPQRPVRRERGDLRLDLAGRQAAGHLRGQLAHGLEVLPDHPVHPQELLEERLADRGAHVAYVSLPMMCSET